LLPVFSRGSIINAAAEKEDNMALMNLGTDTDFGFLNGLKRKILSTFRKYKVKQYLSFVLGGNTCDDLQQIENVLTEKSVFHVMVMMHLALLCNELAAIDL